MHLPNCLSQVSAQLPESCVCTPTARVTSHTRPPPAPQPIEYEDADNPGKVVQLNMSEQEFREFVGLLKEFEPEEDSGKKK